jgi:uncharacterized YccA/Bax inhibitor family protein
MSNPVLARSPVFGAPARASQAARPLPYAAPTTGPNHELDPATLAAAYNAPSATAYDTGRLTYDDVIVKTAGLLGVIVVAGALAWAFAPGLSLPFCLIAFVIGMICAFKRKPVPVLIVLYSVFEGAALGGLSRYFEQAARGIVIQAVLATVAVFAVVLLAFKSGKVRATSKLSKIVLCAMGGYVLFGLINLGLSWAGVINPLWERTVTIGGVPLGVVISIVAVLLGAYSFVMDFDYIRTGVQAGIPRQYAWSGAFGIVTTLIWLYLEFLRLISYARN